MGNLKSPLLVYVIGVALGCGLDAIIKHVAVELAVITLLAWRFFFGGGMVLGVYIAAKKPAPKWPAIRFHTLRSMIHVGSAFLFFWALTQLSLAEVTVIGFTACLLYTSDAADE